MREAPKDATLASHKLLYQAGYIRELASGRYMLTPLGFRVEKKLMQIIDEEMEKIDSQRLVVPTLHPLELWQATHRDQVWGEGLSQVTDRRGAKFAVGATAEAVMVEFVKKFHPSWRDLPIVIHQFSNKFRDELRARGGLIRTREFVMKDAYSFAGDQEGFMQTYWDQFHAYEKIAQRLGIKVIPVEADSGALGGDFCHEFVVPCDWGEDTIFTCDCGYAANKERAEFVRSDVNSKDQEKPLEIVQQPEWVASMDDNVKHYGLPKSRYLKNVVYKTPKGKIVVAVIRGDLEVNEAKLTKVVNEGELIPATDEDLAKMGTRAGWVHSWGHSARYIGDTSLLTVKNFIGGQKEKNTDSINVNYGRDFTCELLADVAEAKEGFICGRCRKLRLKALRGIEFGHVFKYDDFYTKTMECTFTDKDGKEKYLQMGAYGIGIERAMGIVAETYHDDKGLMWPKVLSPYQVHLISMRGADARAMSIYKQLLDAGVEVLYDDREEVSAGVKFADADLIGIPVRLVVSEKTGDKVEYKEREKEEKELLNLEKVIEKL